VSQCDIFLRLVLYTLLCYISTSGSSGLQLQFIVVSMVWLLWTVFSSKTETIRISTPVITE